MSKLLKKGILGVFLLLNLNVFAQFSYKINFQADPILKKVNSLIVSGETNVRIKLIGDNGLTILVGKVMVGDFSIVTKKDQPDLGSVIGLEIELTGNNWTKPIKITNINVKKESDDATISKKYEFSCGCTLTPGNSKVEIDEAGPLNFVEAQIEDPDFKLDGTFSTAEIAFASEKVKGTISRTREPKSEKLDGVPVVEKSPTQICTTEPVQATSSFDINFIQNPNDANIFPGAMLYSEDIANGSYSSYASGSDLNPINLTTTIAIVGGNPTISVIDPDLGTINTAINDLLINQTKGEMEVQASFEVSEINSMEELTLKLGAHFNSATFDAKLSADLQTSERKSIKMVKYVQKYYTVTMVQPKSPLDLFKNKLKATEAFQSGKTPLYVNSITYGRVCFFFLESNQSTTDFKAHLEAEYKGSVTAGGDGDIETKNDINSMKYSATIIGGTGANGILAVNGFDGFMKMLQDDGKLDKTALALPISYSCRFLADNKQAFVNLFSSYTKRTCVPVKSDKIKCQFVLTEMRYAEGDASSKDFAYLVNMNTINIKNPPTINPIGYQFFFSSEKGIKNTNDYFTLEKGKGYTIDSRSEVFEVKLDEFNSGDFQLNIFPMFKTWWGLNSYTNEVEIKKIMLKDALIVGQQAAAAAQQNMQTIRIQKFDVVMEFKFYVRLIE